MRECCGCGECKSVTLFAKTERKCKKCRSDDRQKLKAKARELTPPPPRKKPTFDAAVPMRAWGEPVNREAVLRWAA
jgi:hypothetical protein